MISDETAYAALDAISRQFADWFAAFDTHPQIIRDWTYPGGTTPTACAIVWQRGPDQWAMRAQNGGLDEALTALVRDFDPDAGTISTPPATGWPAGVYSEPVNAWSVGLFAED